MKEHRPPLRRPEQALHRAVVKLLHWNCRPDVVWLHIPNGGRRGKVEAAIFKGLGVQAGFPDLLFLKPRKYYDGGCLTDVIALELKAQNGKRTTRLSCAQIAMHQRLREAGAVVAVAATLDDVCELLSRWGVLQRPVSPLYPLRGVSLSPSKGDPCKPNSKAVPPGAQP